MKKIKKHNLVRFNNSADLGTWYDNKYTEMDGGWKVGQEEALRLIEWAGFEKDGKTLLDIGCGDGDFISHITSYFKCTGIDLSAKAIEFATKRGILATFEVKDIENTTYPIWAFKYLTSIGSIEHVINLDKALSECYRIIEPGGRFLCMVPNERWQHFDQPQEQTHTDREWQKLFEKAGFITHAINRRGDLTDFLLLKPI